MINECFANISQSNFDSLFGAWLCKDREKANYLPSTVQEVRDGAQSGAQR